MKKTGSDWNWAKITPLFISKAVTVEYELTLARIWLPQLLPVSADPKGTEPPRPLIALAHSFP